MTNYEAWQLENFGSILNTNTPDDDFESGIDELNSMAVYVDEKAELQMFEHENL